MPQVNKLQYADKTIHLDQTAYNNIVKCNIRAITAGDAPEITEDETLTALSAISTSRAAYSDYTRLLWTPGDIAGDERALIIATEKTTDGHNAEIHIWTLTPADDAEQWLAGMDGDKDYWIQAIKYNNAPAIATECSPPVKTLQEDTTMSQPIGSIAAWHKSLTGCPALPGDWVECNGQTLSDSDSPFDGQTIPNLNGDATGANSPGLARKEKMFLRGDTSSGTGQDDATAVNGLNVENDTHNHTITHNADNISGIGVQALAGYDWGYRTATIACNNDTHDHNLTGDTETRPPNMTVVWIMRIK